MRQGPPSSSSAGASAPSQPGHVFALAGSSRRSLGIGSGSDLGHQEAQLSSYTQPSPAPFRDKRTASLQAPGTGQVGFTTRELNLSAGASFRPLNPWSVEKCPWTWPCQGGGSLDNETIPPTSPWESFLYPEPLQGLGLIRCEAAAQCWAWRSLQ